MATRSKSSKPQTETRDWHHSRDLWVKALEKQTAHGLDHWKELIARANIRDKDALRAWLAKQGVTGYAEQLLVMEQFGYPYFVSASANDLIDAQYADRPALRPIYEAIVKAAEDIGDIVIQARKGYVSLLTPRRTFARIQATTKQRVDLGLRLEKQEPVGNLMPSRIHQTMPLQISLATIKEFDDEARQWVRRAYEENT